MKLSDLVFVKQEQCAKCLSYIYTLPHTTDLELAALLRVFGREKYKLGLVNLFKVGDEQFYVEFILGLKTVKIWFEKALGNNTINERHNTLRDCLTNWLSDKLDSDIERG
jgi:hypothetical protein